jgi:hypothetical protein
MISPVSVMHVKKNAPLTFYIIKISLTGVLRSSEWGGQKWPIGLQWNQDAPRQPEANF